MKTQGISLVSTGQTSTRTASTSGTKASSTSFDSYMNTQTKNVKSAKQTDAVQTADKPSKEDYVKVSDNSVAKKDSFADNGQELVKNQPFTDNKVAVTVKSSSDTPEEVDVTAFENQMLTALSQMFGMSEEEMTDVLEQSGLDISNLLFQVQPDDTISLVNTDALQQLVMDVHGIEDKSAFLTNDLLSSELTELTDMVKELGAETLGVEPENLPQIEQSVMLSFAEQFAAVSEQDGETAGIRNDVTSVANALSQENELSDDGNTGVQTGMQVIVENAENENETGSQMQNNEEQADSQTADETQNVSSGREVQEHTDSMTAADLFTERLSEAFGETADESVAGPETVMRDIVEQVVRQVRIRVLPETTSMELQLNPASLGRVNLHVSSTGGISTATMVVENQMAKEALESQMITLKQSFEEQGLKVDAVEVTVSEFGLKRDQEQAFTGQNNQNQNGRRQFREDAGTVATEDTGESAVQTAEARRDINSVVDYTA